MRKLKNSIWTAIFCGLMVGTVRILDDGLNPPGEIDGGMWQGNSNHPEFSNAYWNLIQGAIWLGKTNSANARQKEKAARDMRKDSQENAYLPIIMGNWNNERPQPSQSYICQAIYPGELFQTNDPLVIGSLNMLKATEHEGTVWLAKGNGQKAAQFIYTFADHAAPVLDSCEEQFFKGSPNKHVSGEMPHNWVSAEFIRLTAHLLEIDRGNELHLFEGLPREWTRPSMTTRFNGIVTPFSKLTMELKIAADGNHPSVRYRLSGTGQ